MPNRKGLNKKTKILGVFLDVIVFFLVLTLKDGVIVIVLSCAQVCSFVD